MMQGSHGNMSWKSITFLRGLFPGCLISQSGNIPWTWWAQTFAYERIWNLMCMLLFPIPHPRTEGLHYWGKLNNQ
jgi:hypothetical protein